MKYRTVILSVLAVVVPLVSYLLQVDPLSLCKGNLPQEQPLTTDAGVK